MKRHIVPDDAVDPDPAELEVLGSGREAHEDGFVSSGRVRVVQRGSCPDDRVLPDLAFVGSGKNFLCDRWVGAGAR
ncbi:MAG: hypothetical protein PVH82_05590 [Desulfobacteraceae bacterium]|jgi:hypothetical protein